MSRTPQSISIGQTATTDIQTIYTGITGQVLSPSLVFTNASATAIEISVYVNDGSTDFLIETRTVAAGVGKPWIVSTLGTQKIDPLNAIKFQATTATAVNHHLSGSINT